MLSKEELIKIGVNTDNLTYPMGEMNVIVQLMGKSIEDKEDEGDDFYEMNPDVYQPRKNRVWSCACSGGGYDISTDDNKLDFVKHLRDSAERLKIMSYYLSQQANEIEEFGYPKTTCYYPE